MTHFKPLVLMFVNVDWFFVSHRKPIAAAANQYGMHMEVFAEQTSKKFFEGNVGFKFSESPLRRRLFLLSMPIEIYKLLKVLLSKRPSVVHAVTIKPIIFLGLACRIFNIPFVGSVSGLGPAFTGRGLVARIRRRFLVYVYKIIFRSKSAIVICQTDHDLNFLRSAGAVKESNLELIPGAGVDLELFDASLAPSRDVRKMTILLACRLLEDKGIFEYIEAVKIFLESDLGKEKKIKFILAGPEDSDSPTAVSIAEVKLKCETAGVEFVGEIKNMAEYLKEVSIFVYPSYYPEGLPKVLLEVSACGIPIVTTDHPGCSDAISHLETGLVVPPRDSEALAQAMARLIADPDTLAAMSRAARRRAVERFGVTGVIAEHYKIYHRLQKLRY